MRKEHLIYGGMWAVAIVAVGGLWITQESGTRDTTARDGDDATVRLATDGPTPGLSRREPQASQRDETAEVPRMHRGDTRHTGRSRFLGPARAERYWAYETGNHVVGQAVVGRDGTLYVGSRDRHVYALSASGGSVVWQRDLGGDVYSSPALHTDGEGRELLYVGSDSNYFFVLDAASGDVRVHLRTDGDVDTGIVVGDDGTAYFGAGQELWAVAPDGTVRFRFRANDKIFSSPSLDDDGTLYVGSQDDHLYAITPEGQLRWSFTARNDIDSGPVVGDDGTIYFGSDDHRVYALDRNGELRWQADVGGYVRTPVALGLDGNVLVPVFGPHARLVSLDAQTGEEQWYFSVSRSQANELGVGSSPVVDRDGNIYFGADDDYLYALDRRGGMRWIYQTRGNVDADPILATEGVLVIGSDDHFVHALRADPPFTGDAGIAIEADDAAPAEVEDAGAVADEADAAADPRARAEENAAPAR
jgi:outer membrane protein assembly factor BamB